MSSFFDRHMTHQPSPLNPRLHRLSHVRILFLQINQRKHFSLSRKFHFHICSNHPSTSMSFCAGMTKMYASFTVICPFLVLPSQVKVSSMSFRYMLAIDKLWTYLSQVDVISLIKPRSLELHQVGHKELGS